MLTLPTDVFKASAGSPFLRKGEENDRASEIADSVTAGTGNGFCGDCQTDGYSEGNGKELLQTERRHCYLRGSASSFYHA